MDGLKIFFWGRRMCVKHVTQGGRGRTPATVFSCVLVCGKMVGKKVKTSADSLWLHKTGDSVQNRYFFHDIWSLDDYAFQMFRAALGWLTVPWITVFLLCFIIIKGLCCRVPRLPCDWRIRTFFQQQEAWKAQSFKTMPICWQKYSNHFLEDNTNSEGSTGVNLSCCIKQAYKLYA